MNQKSFIEACNMILKAKDTRISIYLKSGRMIFVDAAKKEIFDDYVIFEVTCNGVENEKVFKIVPYANIETIES